MLKFASRALWIALTALASVASGATVTLVASGLNNPRGIAFGPEGGLYVAEAGYGGPVSCGVGPDGVPASFGFSGSVTRIDLEKGTQERIVTGLPSKSAPNGTASGPVDIAFQGRGDALVIIGNGGPPNARMACPGAENLGKLIQVSASGNWKIVADVAAHELTNPDGRNIDTNPYSIAISGSRRVVADAGGNDLIEVSPNGTTTTLAVLPPVAGVFDSDPVPNSVTFGPDGAVYAGQLTGAPFPAGAASVFRVSRDGILTRFATGFTSIIDIAFGPDGALYVLQIFPGNLIRVAPDGSRSVIYSGLSLPGGLAFGPDGSIYVTNLAVVPGAGQVLRIQP
jgi:sugar lactone lactonase YvrE